MQTILPYNHNVLIYYDYIKYDDGNQHAEACCKT